MTWFFIRSKTGVFVVKAIIFDMYETLATQYSGNLYFGEKIAQDLKIEEKLFMPIWRNSKQARTIGSITFEEIIETIMMTYDLFSNEKIEQIVGKRQSFEKEAFININEDVIPMLSMLKNKGFKLGLITNCFSEEVIPIQQSDLFNFFDATCLSFLEGCHKPDDKIYRLCIERLQVKPSECVYVGDGKEELEKAKELGMRCFQALWYIGNHPENESRRWIEFEALYSPMDIFEFL